MADEPTTFTEEHLSEWMDEEMNAADRGRFEEQLARSPELQTMARAFRDSSELFAVYRSEKPEEPPFERFWEELRPQIKPHPGVTTAADAGALVKMILDAQRPTVWERLIAGFMPALLGAAAALLVVFLGVGRSTRSPVTRESGPNTGTATARAMEAHGPLMVNRHESRKAVVKVGTNPDMKSGPAVPNTDVASIVTETDSCIIESMSAEDDAITTVFKVADTDGSMITVIWLPMEDEGTNI